MSLSSLSSLTSTKTVEKISFRYIWQFRILQRQLNHNEAIILQISPKFATVFDHVAFQWTIKLHGSASLVSIFFNKKVHFIKKRPLECLQFCYVF